LWFTGFAVLLTAAVAGCSFGTGTAVSPSTSPFSTPTSTPATTTTSPADDSFLSDARQLKPMPSPHLTDSLLVHLGHAYCDRLNQGGSIAPIINMIIRVPIPGTNVERYLSGPVPWDANEAVLAAAIHNYCPSNRTAFETAWQAPGRPFFWRVGEPQRVEERHLIHRLLSYVRRGQ
jgi:hypothetical protein